MKHVQVQFVPDHVTVEVPSGTTLLEAAGHAGIILSTPCGGTGRCGKCKALLLPSKKEVLACHYQINSDLSVEIPPQSRFFNEQIIQHSISHNLKPFPAIRKILIDQLSPSMDTLISKLSEILQIHVFVDETVSEELDSKITELNNAPFTAVLVFIETADGQAYKLTGLENGNTCNKIYGLAVDIGTTTLAAQLIDLNTGQQITTTGTSNPQHAYGADVVSRISFCDNEDGPEKLHKAIINGINDLITRVSISASIQTEDIYEIVIAGNTTMNHLFLGYPVSQLGQAPYHPYSLESTNHPILSFGLDINPAGNIHTMSNIAGFVGSDTLAAALACGLDMTEYTTLLVDIGTNGEIVLLHNQQLYAASCAAGPALEGAGIEYGSRAQDGAIERILYDGSDIDLSVIGHVPAQTICGSGLIDAVAVMLENEIIESSGRFCTPSELNPLLPSVFRQRLIQNNSEYAFVLTDPKNSESSNRVMLTQGDVRQFQLAKAAILAGILSLLKTAGISIDQIDQLLLAGAFGNYLDRTSAIRTGLLPNLQLEKIHYVGNAAGAGAEMVLIDRNVRIQANQLAKRIKYVEIANQSQLTELFSECLIFPEK